MSKDIIQGERCISINPSQSMYERDVTNFFDVYFSAVDENVTHLNFTKPRLTKLVGWPFPVWLPSFCEPISELQGYVKHSQLEPGDTAIDAGGFAGVTAMLLAREVGASGEVICVEPDPISADCITRNFTLFQDNYGYAPKLVQAALWGTDGVVQFSSESAMGSSATCYVGDRGNILSVPSVSLSTLTSNLNDVHYVKLDIEGAEAEVLTDTKFWRTHNPRLSVECHHNVAVIKNMLSELDYSFEEVSQSGSPFPLLNAERL